MTDHAPHADLARAFGSSSGYERHAKVQRQVAEQLAARIAELDVTRGRTTPLRALELGCGTGFLTRALAACGVNGDWLITDLSPEMVERCQSNLSGMPRQSERRFAVLDGEYADAPGGPFDLICSSLAVQWFDDAPAALARLACQLAPGGHLVITTLGPGTFAEWHRAHRAEGLEAGTPRFPPADAFAALGPLEVDVKALVEVETLREQHSDARAFLRAVKAIGAGSPASGHRPLTPAALRRVMARFDAQGGAASYEVVTVDLHRGTGPRHD